MTGWVPDVLPGYWQCTIPLGHDPAGEGDIVATLVRRGPERGSPPGRRTRCWRCTATPTTSSTPHWPITSPSAGSPSMRWTCRSAAGRGATARRRTSSPTSPAMTPNSNSALAVIAEQDQPAKVLVYGHSAGGLIVSLWLDRMRRRGAAAHAGIGGLVLNSPFLDLHGPAILRLPVTSAMIAGLSRVRSKGVVRGAHRGRLRHHPAPRLRRRVRLRPAVEAVGRLPDHLRVAARHPPRPGPAAPRARRRCAEPDLAFGPQRARNHRPDGHAVRRRGSRRHPDRQMGGLYRQPQHHRSGGRRQARRVPVAAGAAPGRLSPTGPLAGSTTSTPTTPTPRHRLGKG